MNSVQRKYRINDRKFINTELEKGFNDDMNDSIIRKDNYRKLLEDAGIPYTEKVANWMDLAKNKLNLYNRMDVLDGCNRKIYCQIDHTNNYLLKSIPMNDGSYKIALIYRPDTTDEVCISTDFANDELSFEYQMAYDIYSGCPRFEWKTDVENHIKNAVSIINAAKDGEVFRRDIFTCEAYDMAFIPIDIVNLRITIDKKIKFVPYITGYLKTPIDIAGAYSMRLVPYTLKASLAGVGTKYLNEELIVPGEHISLSGMNNLFVQYINDRKESAYSMDGIAKRSLAILTKAKTRHEDLFINGYSLFNQYIDPNSDFYIKYIDDYKRENAKQIQVLPQLLKYTKYQTAM